jgi:Transposase DDE domain
MARPPDAAGVVQQIPGTSDSGAEREAAAQAVEQRGWDPSRATGRQRHPVLEPEEAAAPPTATARLAATGRPPAGRARDARRPVIVEPVCGQRKAARGLRRCLRRGLATIRGAWGLVCVTPTLRKMWRYTCTPITVEADKRGRDVAKRGLCRTTIASERIVARRHRPNVSGKHTPFAWTVSLTGDQ